jgi:hypothetical protein
LQYATGRTQFIRFHGAAEGHPRVARHGSEGTVAEAAASRTNSGRALYNQALAGGPGVSRPDYTARELVTQTARCERISHTRLKRSFSVACGNRANFCDANWLYTRAGWRRGMRWSAPVDSAGDRSYTSGIARQPGNFGLSDLEVIEKRGNRGWHVPYITGSRVFRAGRDCIEWGGCFLTRRHGGAEKHAENMFGLASALGTQHRKVKTRERGVSGDHTASQRGSRWGGRLTTGARGGYCEAV